MSASRFRSFGALALIASFFVAGCSSSGMRQVPAVSGVHLTTPQSLSPGSITPAPMAHTAILPASVMQSAAVRTPKGDIQGLNYTQIPGAATYAAAAPDGSLWVLSDQPSGADKYIWHYSSGSWTNISGLASRLSVAPDGTLYTLNSGGGLYAYISGTGLWTAVAGGSRDLSVASDGSLYTISSGSDADGAIWHFAGGSWSQLPGSGSRIAASWDPNTYANPGGSITPGGFYVINSQGSIYHLGASGYVQFPGAASSVAPITGGLFALGYPADPNGNVLYYYDLSNPNWSAKGGSGASISSDGKTLYIVGASGNIYSSPITPVGTTATFTVKSGSGGSLQSSRRQPEYVSASTAFIAITVNGTIPMTFPCNGSCSQTFSVPPGNDTFIISDEDSSGTILSTATISQACTAGANTIINAVLSGIPAYVGIALHDRYAPMGSPFTTKVLVTAYDQDQNVIIGPGNFWQPIILNNSDSSGSTQLSETSVQSPSDVVTLSYDGQGYVNPVITASVPRIVTQALPARLVPIVNVTETSIPSASNTGRSMALGSDGALWFAETRAIGRVTTSGTINEYPVSSQMYGPGYLALGPGGNIWFDGGNGSIVSQTSYLAYITPSGTMATNQAFSPPTPGSLTLGPDGNIWFLINGSIAKLTGITVTQYSLAHNGLSASPADMTLGPDGNFWVAESYGYFDKYVISSNSVTAYQTPPIFPGASPGSMQPFRIVAGPNNDLYLSSSSELAKTDTSGNIVSTYQLTYTFANPGQMSNAFNAVWVPLNLNGDGHPMVGHIGTNGQYAELALSAVGQSGDQAAPVGAIALGSDNNLWYIRKNVVGWFSAH